jgi:hypothetical protein
MSTSVHFEDHARYLKGKCLGEFVGPLFIVVVQALARDSGGKGFQAAAGRTGWVTTRQMLHRRSAGSCSGELLRGALREAHPRLTSAHPLGRDQIWLKRKLVATKKGITLYDWTIP